MRSSSGVHRRAHQSRDEEKKDDNDKRLPIVQDDDCDKDRHRNWRLGSLVKLGRHLSTPSVLSDHGRFFFLPTLAVFTLIYHAFSEPGLFRPTRMNRLKIIMPIAGSRVVALPGAFESTQEEFYAPFYELTLDLLMEDSFMRNVIYTGNEEIFGRLKLPDDPALSKWNFAFDDDNNRNPYRGWGAHNKNHLERKNHCRQTVLRKESFFSTCNDFHSLGFDSFVSRDRGKYIGGGSFRDVFLLEEEHGDPYVILKTASYSSKYKPHAWELYRMDAAVTSAISPHPLVVDIFGTCSLAMLSEPLMQGDVDVASIPIYRRHHCRQADIEGHSYLVKMNDLNATTKLEWALQMSEAVAILHNHPKGVIIHDDVQLFQWLVADDGHIKMNDFNRAEVRSAVPVRLFYFISQPLNVIPTSSCFMTKSMKSTANTRMGLDRVM